MRLASCIRYAPADTGTTASAAIQGQDVESFKSGAQAASMDVDSSQKMDAGKQSETARWQAETLRNRSRSNRRSA